MGAHAGNWAFTWRFLNSLEVSGISAAPLTALNNYVYNRIYNTGSKANEGCRSPCVILSN